VGAQLFVEPEMAALIEQIEIIIGQQGKNRKSPARWR
jgi:hypothetical protein